jgi:hypothetical protein
VCLGIELNPSYVDVAVKRWQQFAGEAAMLDRTEQTFADLGQARRGNQLVILSHVGRV